MSLDEEIKVIEAQFSNLINKFSGLKEETNSLNTERSIFISKVEDAKKDLDTVNSAIKDKGIEPDKIKEEIVKRFSKLKDDVSQALVQIENNKEKLNAVKDILAKV